DPSNNSAMAETAVTGPFAGDVLISEFRLRGPGGDDDEFIEIYNNTDTPVAVTPPTILPVGPSPLQTASSALSFRTVQSSPRAATFWELTPTNTASRITRPASATERRQPQPATPPIKPASLTTPASRSSARQKPRISPPRRGLMPSARPQKQTHSTRT